MIKLAVIKLDFFVKLAHEDHQGIVRTKQLNKEKVWFVSIDKQVKKFCKGRISVSRNNMSPPPIRPWSVVRMDFCGSYKIVIIDEKTTTELYSELGSLVQENKDLSFSQPNR